MSNDKPDYLTMKEQFFAELSVIVEEALPYVPSVTEDAQVVRTIKALNDSLLNGGTWTVHEMKTPSEGSMEGYILDPTQAGILGNAVERATGKKRPDHAPLYVADIVNGMDFTILINDDKVAVAARKIGSHWEAVHPGARVNVVYKN